MVTVELTPQQNWIFSNGYYGHWWDFPPHNTKEYQKRFQQCLKEGNKLGVIPKHCIT